MDILTFLDGYPDLLSEWSNGPSDWEWAGCQSSFQFHFASCQALPNLNRSSICLLFKMVFFHWVEVDISFIALQTANFRHVFIFFQKFSKKKYSTWFKKKNEIPHQPRIKETELAKKMIPMDNFNKRLMNLKLSDPFGIITDPTCQESGHETPVLLQRDGSSAHKAKLKLPKNALPTKHLLQAVCLLCAMRNAQMLLSWMWSQTKKNSTWRWIHLQKTSKWYIFFGGATCRVWFTWRCWGFSS